MRKSWLIFGVIGGVTLLLPCLTRHFASPLEAAPVRTDAPMSRPAHAVQAAEKAALSWLAMVDAGNYQASWQKASPVFQSAISQRKWVQALLSVRKPLGHEQGRVLTTATYTTTLPGAAAGEYVVIQFHTIFSQAGATTEMITPMRGMDGQWKVSGYFIKPQ